MPNIGLTTTAPETLEDGSIHVEVTLPVRPRRQECAKGGQPDQVAGAGSSLRIPRITRLMALAIKFETMIECGEVRDYADLARLGYVTRARITQIMNLLNLAPNIQEELLSIEAAARTSERNIRCLASLVEWKEQRQRWNGLKAAER